MSELAANAPVILHEGNYRLYQKPDGTLRVQYRRSDRDEDDFLEIPGMVLRLAQSVSEGKMNPLQALKAMRQARVLYRPGLPVPGSDSGPNRNEYRELDDSFYPQYPEH